MRNLNLESLGPPSAFRRISTATWPAPSDPTVHGAITLNMTEALRYMEEYRQATGRRLTVNHLVARALGAVLTEVPESNVIIRMGRVWRRTDHTVFFQVAMLDPKTGRFDLSGVTVERASERSLADILDAFETSVARVKRAEDPQLEGTRRLMKVLPTWIVAVAMRVIPFLLYTVNVDLSFLGLPGNTFGAVAVTNIGSLGIEEAYVPIVPYTRTPMFLALGTIAPTPVVRDGEVVAAPCMKVMATFDHRALDGSHAAQMCRILRAWMEDPFNHFGPIPGSDAA